ncbi:hypothetical protein SAMN05216225_102915 [Ornithinibacillus halophilus]|uniref:Uncharacterized protein n=1 Tax=Ornithinibacillus halophilus TaxID=930117 RepID=A0A1M5JAT3_9BACI|nr:hypothetical protein SAMN05216225_102915 [Ornithinibacillus halophilus]
MPSCTSLYYSYFLLIISVPDINIFTYFSNYYPSIPQEHPPIQQTACPLVVYK